MNTFETIRRALRTRKLKHLVNRGDDRVQRVGEAVDALIGWARADEVAGVRKDRVLFDFEADFEEISDEIARLSDAGEKEAYRDIYAKLYDFAQEQMADSYMPLYLYILYRYANALLGAGEAGEAAQMFEKLCTGTDRLIGIRNSYGIHCMERLAVSAARCGQIQTALNAIDEMQNIANDEDFGPNSAVSLAVERFSRRLRAEMLH